MEAWLVAFIDECPSHLLALPEQSEQGSVRLRITDPRPGMLVTDLIPCSGIPAAVLLHHKRRA